MDLIITLIAYLVVIGLVWWLVSLLPLPMPVAAIVRVLFTILVLMVVLAAFDIIPKSYLPHIGIPGLKPL